MKEQKVSHADAQSKALTSSISLRIYGVPLENANTREGHTVILFSGLCAGGVDHRECTNRIWHVPEENILKSGILEDFTCEGKEVYWFDLHKDTTPIEEKYTAISLGRELNQLVPRSLTEECTSVFAVNVGAQVPITISPGFQAETVPGDRTGGFGCRALRESGLGTCHLTLTGSGQSDTQMIIY